MSLIELTIPKFTITNKGLKITIEATGPEEKVWRISLGCRKSGGNPRDTIGILLRELGGGEFVRWEAHRCIQWQGDNQGHDVTFYIKKLFDDAVIRPLQSRSFQFHAKGSIRFENAMPKGNWDPHTASFNTEDLEVFEGFVFCHYNRILSDIGETDPFVVACGFGPGNNGMWACIASAMDLNSIFSKLPKLGTHTRWQSSVSML